MQEIPARHTTIAIRSLIETFSRMMRKARIIQNIMRTPPLVAIAFPGGITLERAWHHFRQFIF